jgi:hypothetical protein
MWEGNPFGLGKMEMSEGERGEDDHHWRRRSGRKTMKLV